ncbi:MAG: chromosome partitioning protein ParB [Oricola sp.]|nr:MAG: chromosome partitioning protein ParB [Oricola sp.]
MSGQGGKKIAFDAKPSASDWVRDGEETRAPDGANHPPTPKADIYTARLTIDVTPELRGRIKLAAFGRGTTVAELLRALLDREFPAETNAQQSTSERPS